MACILVLDDNQAMVDMMGETLEVFGYETMSGRNGLEGLELLATANPLPDLIICDLHMPGMDGVTFIGNVRDRLEWACIPILVLSGSDDGTMLNQIDNVVFLEKPFSMPNLNALVDRMIASNSVESI